ncbi:hypothetical protein [Gemmobacter nectariphilus]|uniref:hypothetical protein n=1 Tax=Gemmobacter nectariphilus TaxID=220343 RepID=UPI000420F29A|nr:hypothetical protein [Gemmobacter nectariphilus]
MTLQFRLMSWLLCLVLALTSGTMAVARGQMAAAGSIVICSGYGVITVLVDDRGEPLGTVHPCPDCIAAHVVALLPPVPVVVRPLGLSRIVWAPVATGAVPLSPATPKARGPPLAV